jgi:hypothetical protein
VAPDPAVSPASPASPGQREILVAGRPFEVADL